MTTFLQARRELRARWPLKWTGTQVGPNFWWLSASRGMLELEFRGGNGKIVASWQPSLVPQKRIIGSAATIDELCSKVTAHVLDNLPPPDDNDSAGTWRRMLGLLNPGDGPG